MILSGPRILFIANAGPEIGGGHVMRSITLARALAARGAICAMAASPEVAAILDQFAPELAREEATSLSPDDLADALTGADFEAIVFDHYGLDRDDHVALAHGRPALVLDDLANRPLGGDMIVDSGPARSPTDYALLVEDGVRLLLGPAYAPVRPEFADLRDAALARRGGPVRRVLLALGLTDPGGLTSRIVDRLRLRLGDLALDVVIGGSAPGQKALMRVAAHDPRLSIHVDTPHMGQLIAEADIGIGAAGSTTWERCVLGLPQAILIVAENQRPAAQALADRGAALVIDAGADHLDQAIDRMVVRLLTDSALRERLTASSATICDGRGAARTAEAFLGLIAERGAPPQARDPLNSAD